MFNNATVLKVLTLLGVIFLCGDISYTFFQHYSMPLDGDMADGLVPARDVKLILADPFGWSVLTGHARYANPNRGIGHWIFYGYFNTVPQFLQHFFHPVESVYVACALIKTLVHIGYLWLLLKGVGLFFTFSKKTGVLLLILVASLLQTTGYSNYMGIIDRSITYFFFYSLPVFFVGIYCWLLLRVLIKKDQIKHKNFNYLILTTLGVLLPFTGPLSPGILLVFCLVISSYLLIGSKSIYSYLPVVLLIALVGIVSIYSLYIGQFNTIFEGHSLALTERYLRLPQGIYYLLTGKIGWIVLLLLITFNWFYLKRFSGGFNEINYRAFYRWIGLFSLVYLLVLPLGGYKDYRPYIIRFDTFIPVTVCMFFLALSTSYMVCKLLKNKWLYLPVIIAIAGIFYIADLKEGASNTNEKTALNLIHETSKDSLALPHSYRIMEWDESTEPKNAINKVVLLQKWNIASRNFKIYSYQTN